VIVLVRPSVRVCGLYVQTREVRTNVDERTITIRDGRKHHTPTDPESVSSAELAVFEVQYFPGRVRAIGIGQASCKARDNEAGKVADCHPFDSIDFDAIKEYMTLVLAEFSAVKYVEYLVAFPVVWCPIVNQQALDGPIQSQFLAHLAFASGGRGFATLDIAARNVPTITVSLMG
jgi:hypothetical protein